MAGKQYRVYKVTGPDGRCYIGYTSMSIKERWQHHKRRAFQKNTPKEHPFYQMIREVDPAEIQIEELYAVPDRRSAMILEERCIAAIPPELSLNLSSGGINDAAEGGRIFWERINSDPEKRKEYLKKLSDVKKENDWTDYDNLSQRALQWRKDNARTAYYNAYRAIRIATRAQGRPSPSEARVDERPLKERLQHKYKLNQLKSQYVTEVWKGRSEVERIRIGEKIGASQKRRFEKMSPEELSESTKTARECIDREKQGRAASQGLKSWWAELKKDPERYRDYMERRSRTASQSQKRYAAALNADERKKMTEKARAKHQQNARMRKEKEATA